jgi:hypothetical protein
MNFFGLGKKELSDNDLRNMLFGLAASGESTKLEELVKDHLTRIQTLFPSWKVVPADIRKNQAQTKWWIEGVMATAHAAALLGDQSLLALLEGKPEENPLVRWADALRAAELTSSRAKYGEGIRILENILIQVNGLTGTGVDEYLPKTYGLLGTLYYRAGNRELARSYTIRAKEYCEQINDPEGVRIYTQNLAVIDAG